MSPESDQLRVIQQHVSVVLLPATRLSRISYYYPSNTLNMPLLLVIVIVNSRIL